MLVMDQIRYIKHLREREGKSIQVIADTLGIDWRTAKKYADCEDFNLPPKRKQRKPVMDPYETIIDTWLLEDRKLPRKQRHTAKRIYDRLVREHGFEGGGRTVRRYVSHRKQLLGQQQEEVYAQLSHPKTHTQADFGEFRAFRDGRLTTFHYLVLSFPYSNAGFAQVLPGENSECLLEGLKWIFQHLGGVPRKIRFDNLTAAVTIRNRNRKIAESFDRFCLHYGFEAEFCNIARANEKGSVENKVGYSRRNWFVPIPSIDDISTFNQQLFGKAEEDLKRSHYEKGDSLAELFAQERSELLLLPRVPFEVVRWDTARVDKYGRVKLDAHHYHGVPAGAGERVILKASWNTVVVFNENNEAMAQYPRIYHQQEEAVNWQAQFLLFSRKPGAVPHSVHFELLPPSIRDYLSIEDTQELKQRLRFLSQQVVEHKLETLAVAITQAKQNGQTDPGAIRHELYCLTAPEHLLPMLEAYTPACLHDYRPDLSQYDRLTVGGGE
ncbi:MAG: IS21 family transposase [Candidatus Thorarchaeota archaeon]|jgi:transposase